MKLIKYVFDDEGNFVPASTLKRSNTRKHYISKEDFDKYALEKGYSRGVMRSLGVGSKTYINSYHLHYPDPEERELIRTSKLSKTKIGNTHGKAKDNTGIHKIEQYCQQDIQEMAAQNLNLYQIADRYGVSVPTINKVMDHFGIDLPKNSKLNGVTYREFKELEHITGIDLLKEIDSPTGIDLVRLRNLIHQMEIQIQEWKESLASIRYRYSLGASAAPRSRYEREVIIYLLELNIDFIPQYRIDKYPYDLYLPELNILIEVDGAGHNNKTDHIKDSLAKEHDIKLIRLDLCHLKSKKQISEKVRSSLLNQLGKKMSGI